MMKKYQIEILIRSNETLKPLYMNAKKSIFMLIMQLIAWKLQTYRTSTSDNQIWSLSC